jgi:hypothetical protein
LFHHAIGLMTGRDALRLAAHARIHAAVPGETTVVQTFQFQLDIWEAGEFHAHSYR